MYKESVRWYFARLLKLYKDPKYFTLESQQGSKGRSYHVEKYDNFTISPHLNAREMKIWMDAYRDGILASAYIDRSAIQ